MKAWVHVQEHLRIKISTLQLMGHSLSVWPCAKHWPTPGLTFLCAKWSFCIKYLQSLSGSQMFCELWNVDNHRPSRLVEALREDLGSMQDLLKVKGWTITTIVMLMERWLWNQRNQNAFSRGSQWVLVIWFLFFFYFLNLLPCVGIELINNVVVVSGEQWGDSPVHIHVSFLPQTPGTSRLPHNSEQSFTCYTVGPCWLSILNMADYTCLSQAP